MGIILNEVAKWSLSLVDENGGLRVGADKLDGHSISFATLPKDLVEGFKQVYVDSTEPDFLCTPSEQIIERSRELFLILTRRKDILSQCPNNARLFLFGTTWVGDCDIPDKVPTVSFTCTRKNNNLADGYALRHEIVGRLEEVKKTSNIKFEYWASSRFPLMPEKADHFIRESRSPLFSSMFHVAVENQRCEGFFTEKLVDCFRTKTVPIYFGTPDIADYFDPNGMIIVNDFGDLLNVLSGLSPEDYLNMMPHVETNYLRSLEYSRDFTDRFIEIVTERN
jgi:hypothetical protein